MVVRATGHQLRRLHGAREAKYPFSYLLDTVMGFP